MHDPDVVAFTIRRPWPSRARYRDSRSIKTRPRWRFKPPFWTLAGWGFYFPALVTVWHREPGGHDSGEICKNRRWHVQHWRVQLHPLQELRRRLLTRCAWCADRHRRGDPVNMSHSWDGPPGRWWQGEPGLFHHDCSSVARAWSACVCESPILEHDGWGKCLRCDRFRSFGRSDLFLPADRLLAEVPRGRRADPAVMARVREIWASAGERGAS